jgi:hypothetical protein
LMRYNIPVEINNGSVKLNSSDSKIK